MSNRSGADRLFVVCANKLDELRRGDGPPRVMDNVTATGVFFGIIQAASDQDPAVSRLLHRLADHLEELGLPRTAYPRLPALTDSTEDLATQADELTMFVRRLSHSLKNARPDSDLPGKALGYLERIDRQGTPLREQYRAKVKVSALRELQDGMMSFDTIGEAERLLEAMIDRIEREAESGGADQVETCGPQLAATIARPPTPDELLTNLGREQLLAMAEMLRVARCPDRNCDNKGTTVRMAERSTPECCGQFHDNGECCGNAVAGVEAEPEPEPCQWCDEREAMIARHEAHRGTMSLGKARARIKVSGLRQAAVFLMLCDNIKSGEDAVSLLKLEADRVERRTGIGGADGE